MDAAAAYKTLLAGIRDLQITRYAQFSSSFIVFFDHFITIDDEVSLIWDTPWSLGKVLFLINRYYTLASIQRLLYLSFFSQIFAQFSDAHAAFIWGTLTDQVRLRTIRWKGWTGVITCMTAEAILLLRVYALYSLNKKVLALMLVLFIACHACSAWIMGNALSSIIVSTILTSKGRFCFARNIPHRFFAFWIPILSYEFLLCSLALFQGVRTFRSGGSRFGSGETLFGILIRDSVIYFLAIGAIYLTCLLVWALARTSLLEVPVGFSSAFSCVLANRVIFNVRKYRELTAKPSSRTPLNLDDESDAAQDGDGKKSFGPGALTVFQMEQLRAMRAQQGT